MILYMIGGRPNSYVICHATETWVTTTTTTFISIPYQTKWLKFRFNYAPKNYYLPGFATIINCTLATGIFSVSTVVLAYSDECITHYYSYVSYVSVNKDLLLID